MRSRAFTLIEILTVTAIISVLAAILFPVFATAKQRSKQITCLSNIGQLTKASILYWGDCDSESFPGYGEIVSLGADEFPFLKPYGVTIMESPGHVRGPNGQRSSGYSLNACLSPRYPGTDNPASTIVVATRACMLWRNGAFFCDQFSTAPDALEKFILSKRQENEELIGPIGPFGSERFFGGGNYGFFDGHALWARPERLFIPKFDTCDPNATDHYGPVNGLTFANRKRTTPL